MTELVPERWGNRNWINKRYWLILYPLALRHLVVAPSRTVSCATQCLYVPVETWHIRFGRWVDRGTNVLIKRHRFRLQNCQILLQTFLGVMYWRMPMHGARLEGQNEVKTQPLLEGRSRTKCVTQRRNSGRSHSCLYS